ncbi:F-box only protein 4-like [Styela clava]
MDVSDSTDCPCVGSMGLHQNNLLYGQQDSLPGNSFTGLGFNLSQLKSRSVIDVFRGMRDKYFGKPGSQAHELIRKCGDKESLTGIEEENQFASSIDALPVYCKLIILSFLDTQDVCSVSSVNSQWREIANDQILWRELLIRDMCKWDSMTNKSHPLISQVWNNDALKESSIGISFVNLLHEQSTQTNLSTNNGLVQSQNMKNETDKKTDIHAKRGINFKALYIHSSFQRAQDDSEEVSYNLSIPGFIKSLWQGGVAPEQGEIIMTGPGMDSPRTSKIFRALMWGSDFLETKGLLAGNRDGIGSGVQLLFKEKIPFNLIALYSGNNRVRENRAGMERLLHSNVVEPVSSGENVDVGHHEEHLPQFVLYDAVRFYIAERKGHYKLVYVVDATLKQKWDDIACNILELSAILRGTEFDNNINNALGVPIVDLELDGADHPEEHGHINVEPNAVTPSAGSLPFASKRPLLILSCIAEPDVERFSCMQITAMLGLPDVSDRQWRVQDVIVSTMHGVEKGLEWLLRQT